MAQPHTTPTSFKGPILDAAFSVDDDEVDVAKTQELFGEMKQPFQKLNLNVYPSLTLLHYSKIKNVIQDVFDGLHARTTQMASLAGPIGTNLEIAEYVLDRS